MFSYSPFKGGKHIKTAVNFKYLRCPVMPYTPEAFWRLEGDIGTFPVFEISTNIYFKNRFLITTSISKCRSEKVVLLFLMGSEDKRIPHMNHFCFHIFNCTKSVSHFIIPLRCLLVCKFVF